MEVLETLSGDWVRETTGSEHGANTPGANGEISTDGRSVLKRAKKHSN